MKSCSSLCLGGRLQMFNDITENEVGEVNEEIEVSGIYEQLLLASFPTS